MATLVIDLQEGFDGDVVVIMVDGREVFRKAGVRTRYQIGLAESVRPEVTAGRHRVAVELPDRGLSGEVELDAAATPHLAVSAQGDRLVLTLAAEPFRYL